MLELLVEVPLLVLLLACSACFSGTETALFSLDKFRLRELEKTKTPHARVIRELLAAPYTTLITILIGNLLVNTAASSLATLVCIKLFGHEGVGVAIGVMTFVLLICGEYTPKAFSVAQPVAVARRLGRPLQYLTQVLAPLIVLVKAVNTAVLGVLARRWPVGRELSITEEEVQTLLKISMREGHLDAHEHTWIRNIFKFSDLEVKDVMQPAARLISVDCTRSRAAIEQELRTQQHSRLPVHQGDRTAITGILIVKDYLLDQERDIADALRPPLVVRPRERVDRLFQRFRKERMHLALVKQGEELVGFVTMEDVLEQIFGALYDERDFVPETKA
ncbi:MAG TPA: CNNM domain-containing protein [bacterium]|nr:CNNM domain-containing protein [bacterium]